MGNAKFDDRYSKTHEERFKKTLVFMDGLVDKSEKILDLGPVNPFSKKMEEHGYDVRNTGTEVDLDLHPEKVAEISCDTMTAFEIFEHMVSPFPVIQNTQAKKLLASVPLKLWFANAYWNDNDPYDCHYHEFEVKQFNMLLEKAGWKIMKSAQWTNPNGVFGIRPLLRRFVPRHYIVYAERK